MKTNRFLIALVVIGTLLTGCSSRARVGTLQTESRTVELGDAESVVVEINFGAGDLEVTGGAQKLLEADFTYNVAKLKPEVEYSNGKLAVRQPDGIGLPVLQNITDFRNEWGLRLSDMVPMDLSVIIGSGLSDLQLSGLPLTRLEVDLGAGISTVDLTGDWARSLDVTIATGAADITVRLPREVGARVQVESGPHLVVTSGLTKTGNVYTNEAYGVSGVTLQVNVSSGIGQINLEVDEAPAASD